MHGRYAGESAGPARGRIVLRTARLILIPLRRLDEAEHARASKNPADALRDTRAAELAHRGRTLRKPQSFVVEISGRVRRRPTIDYVASPNGFCAAPGIQIDGLPLVEAHILVDAIRED